MQEIVCRTERLLLRKISADDAPFILALLNDPEWIQFIGDRNVRTEEAAREYITSGHWAAQVEMGYGLNVVEAEGVPVGLCGLLKREVLEDVDIGFALLGEFRGKGYALEAAQGILEYGRSHHRLQRLAGIADPENSASIRILETLGMTYRGTIRLPKDDLELSLYVVEFTD